MKNTEHGRIRENFDRVEPSHDYLKYWRVVRYWAKAKWGLSASALDMMFFLYSEQVFTKSKFREFDTVMPWDKLRFAWLLRDGWIVVWKKRSGPRATIYELSYKGKRVVNTIYKKLNGEDLPATAAGNSMFLKDVSYSDKVYRNMIMKMREATRQRLRRAQK